MGIEKERQLTHISRASTCSCTFLSTAIAPPSASGIHACGFPGCVDTQRPAARGDRAPGLRCLFRRPSTRSARTCPRLRRRSSTVTVRGAVTSMRPFVATKASSDLPAPLPGGDLVHRARGLRGHLRGDGASRPGSSMRPMSSASRTVANITSPPCRHVAALPIRHHSSSGCDPVRPLERDRVRDTRCRSRRLHVVFERLADRRALRHQDDDVRLRTPPRDPYAAPGRRGGTGGLIFIGADANGLIGDGRKTLLA